ncbi:cyclase family protein [Ponticoccus alexandrii]|uniref:Cyclase family protein n=1 Tax=Ponticoccus alexandrii TaxID=1943633 RepID=A0ABX7FGE1_9RHOB|nr:cyclase family protein [Ponticoccus alexandrii]ETA51168.1 hypothetical protein P279_15515 [Rhodobacteraceae bacterium PD-2]QRF69119.1 cyclase family protein [Ponticoccus alexandrii]
MKIYDLSMPIVEDHFRWPAAREVTGDHSDAKPFQVTRINLSVHSFTHVDARRHMLPGAPTIEETDLADVAGPCFIAELSDIAPNEEITAERIRSALADYTGEPIILLRSAWSEQRDWRTEAFWRDAPFMSREASRAVAALKPKAVAFDFPQDYTIRLGLDGICPPIQEHVTHDEILRHGITLIEYLVDTAAIPGPRTFLCALPLKISSADGAPARVVAIDGLELSGNT